MNKIRVLCLSIWYPLSMSRYFEKAFRHREDVELLTIGPYTASYIPWLGGMNLPEKYAKPPDLPLPFRPDVGKVAYDYVRALLPQDFKPDIVLSIDAGINWISKPSEGLVATIGTDPHVLDYDHQRGLSDKFFNMQKFYSQKDDIYLPYAYSKYDFYPCDTTEEKVDAVLIGMPYQNRFNWIERLKKHGVSVIFENGPVFDEARAAYARGKIGLNWSSLMDLNCRAFELPAMKLYSVMNAVPDMDEFEFTKHIWQFNDMEGAVEGVLWAKEHPEQAERNAQCAYELVKSETYDARVEDFLKECGYG